MCHLWDAACVHSIPCNAAGCCGKVPSRIGSDRPFDINRTHTLGCGEWTPRITSLLWLYPTKAPYRGVLVEKATPICKIYARKHIYIYKFMTTGTWDLSHERETYMFSGSCRPQTRNRTDSLVDTETGGAGGQPARPVASGQLLFGSSRAILKQKLDS